MYDDGPDPTALFDEILRRHGDVIIDLTAAGLVGTLRDGMLEPLGVANGAAATPLWIGTAGGMRGIIEAMANGIKIQRPVWVI